MNDTKIFRMTKDEAISLRAIIAELKKSGKNARQCAIVGFAKLFGKFLPDYTSIRIGTAV